MHETEFNIAFLDQMTFSVILIIKESLTQLNLPFISNLLNFFQTSVVWKGSSPVHSFHPFSGSRFSCIRVIKKNFW